MVYKCFVFLTTIGAIWAVLITTRLLRGQEDTGRWQLMLAARAPARPVRWRRHSALSVWRSSSCSSARTP